MPGFLYFIGCCALLGGIFAMVVSPVIMMAPAVGTIVSAFLLFGFGRLVEEAILIQKNTRSVAEYFQWLRKRQEAQIRAQSGQPEPPPQPPPMTRGGLFRGRMPDRVSDGA